MKAGIYDPYLDTLGGGERYALTVAEALLKNSWEVDVFWKGGKLKERIKNKFSLEVDRVNYVCYLPRENNLFKRRKFERNYDLLFYFSDGSIPFMFGKNNFLHFQVPFKNVLKRTLINDLKINKIGKIVCNSLFTKKVIDKCLGVKSIVIYPPVDVSSFNPFKKENVILSVGRFSQLLQSKRQDILIECFIRMVTEGRLKGWSLVLAGGSEVGGSNFAKELKEKAKGYAIKIIENPTFGELVDLYGRARIFWTASGYGIDEDEEPEKVEHFGMTTVEAMAAGCVPIVQGKGGQKEIVEDGVNGYLWHEEKQLIDLTIKSIKDDKVISGLSKRAILRSKDFSKEKFYQKIYELVKK